MTWNDIPKTFGLCRQTDCPRAAECLRRVAEPLLPEEYTQWLYVTTTATRGYAEGQCGAYATTEPAEVALGFRRALGSLPNNRQEDVRKALRKALGWNRTMFYRARRGEHPLWADERARVEEVLVRFGVPAPIEFDAYEDRLFFPD